MARKVGRPLKEFDKKSFQDLVGLGCRQEEICFFFRGEDGRPANIDTLSRWCKRTYGQNFQDYFKQNGFVAMKIRLRRNQLKLSEKSAAMAIWLGKQILGQKESVDDQTELRNGKLADLIDGLREPEGAGETGEENRERPDDLHSETAAADAVMAEKQTEKN